MITTHETPGLAAYKAAAYKHRRSKGLSDGPVWPLVGPLFVDLVQSQALLFAGAAGGQVAMVKTALDRGADPNSVLIANWRAAGEHGLCERKDSGPAYLWEWGCQEPRDVARVCLPMEAAIAGADVDCIKLLTSAGADLEAGAKWVFALAPNLPRVEAGLALLRVLRPSDAYQRALGRDYLRRVINWLEERHARDEHYMRWLGLHRATSNIASAYGLKYNPSHAIVAAML